MLGWKNFNALAKVCPRGQELRVVKSREFTYVAGLHVLSLVGAGG